VTAIGRRACQLHARHYCQRLDYYYEDLKPQPPTARKGACLICYRVALRDSRIVPIGPKT